MGYETVEKTVKLVRGVKTKLDITLTQRTIELDEVAVISSGISRLKQSAYNVVAIDTKSLENSTQSLSDALTRAPGMKIRESGGVGSEMQVMMDGFSGRHVKVFIDGVPQEGVGESFGLNNIPVNYAERIEVYKGVVPIAFGTDAIGGVINIVTKKNTRKWFLDASYSYGSFNTHKSFLNFGQTLKNGFTYEVKAFQNYSDNNYYINTPVKYFTSDDSNASFIDKSNIERVKRFHDTYHNEAVVAKVGIVNKKWADRITLGFTYSQMYKEIQTGIFQEIVFGEKHKRGHSLIPSLEYRKKDLLVKNLDIVLTADYNKNTMNNVDTSAYEYTWHQETRPRTSPGEQRYQNNEANNSSWNSTLSANYHISKVHTLSLNHVINSFSRSNKDLLTSEAMGDAIAKETRKNISGLSYRFMPNAHWNILFFGKYYDVFTAGPIATSSAQDKYIRTSGSINTWGYGAAGTYFFTSSLQGKLSYEKACRLPTVDEVFGDDDLLSGNISLKPESSNNFNLNLSYNAVFNQHSLYAEGGLIYRDTKDYIKRNTIPNSGKPNDTFINHDKVETKGYSLSLRYNFAKWLSIGGNLTQMDVKDNVKTTTQGTAQASTTYGERMPNVPYRFGNSDISFYWNNFGQKENSLTITYDNMYIHTFSRHSEGSGDKKSNAEYIIPSQFAHNLTVSYSIGNGRYNLSFECLNFTDEKLYDNFKLQKAGRSFYGKVRIYLGK